MAIWNKKSTLEKAVRDWHERGLIDVGTASALTSDIAASIKPRSFTSIILLLGVICLAFGVMTFVAANWDEMSSLQKVGLLIAALWASWGISIGCKIRSREWAAQLFVMLACAIFGASIMLISQIYHIQGEPKDAVWLWAMGTGLGALVTRSVPALVLYVSLITLWAVMDFKLFGRNDQIEYAYMAYWMLGAVAAWFFASRFTAHILAVGMVFWLLYMVGTSMNSRDGIQNALQLHIVLAACFFAIAANLYSIGDGQWLKGFELPAFVYLFLLLAGLVFIWYVATDMRWNGNWRLVTTHYLPGVIAVVACAALAFISHRQLNAHHYDILVTTIFAIIAVALSGSTSRVPFIMEALMLALSIWCIRMGWRLEFRALSTLGFLGFTGAMLLIYFETLGSLLDTSLFYLGAGALLLAGAIIIPRLMRKPGNEGAQT